MPKEKSICFPSSLGLKQRLGYEKAKCSWAVMFRLFLLLDFFCTTEFNCLKNHIGNQKLIFSIKCFAIPLSTEPGWWYLWQNLNSQVQAGSLFRPWKWLSKTNNPHRDIFIAVDSSSTGLLDRMRFGDLEWAQHQCCHVSSDSVFVAVAATAFLCHIKCSHFCPVSSFFIVYIYFCFLQTTSTALSAMCKHLESWSISESKHGKQSNVSMYACFFLTGPIFPESSSHPNNMSLVWIIQRLIFACS